MKLEVTEEAQEVLKNKLEADDQLLLDIENGDGPFAESQVSCQLDTAFRLIIVKKDTQTDLSLYSVVADTPVGPIKIKDSAILYMDDPSTLALEPTYNSLQLKGPSGLRKGNLQVVRKD
ncbi:iron-sulfur cluster biosynthesis family protein [Enterococcus faecium]|nr:iron-sulfur cluster biosynthesis family protein [Enterococcus faecium]EME3512546.1 iron-sulfur cluster biosynthesis family protein [Enterococcus faecium]NTJ76018.1 iron-sulfur cluster biosynthesis family protein [Enterococcus faecium]